MQSPPTEETPAGESSPAVNETRQFNSDRILTAIALFLIIGGFFSLLSFRIFQPYAFKGEYGFLDVRINQLWMNNIKDQRAQASGDVDFPPALQWADRPVWYSAWNMVVWGLGIPVGVLAFLGSAGWAGASSKASGNFTSCCGAGRCFISSGSRCNTIRPCATRCPSIR